MPQQNTNDRVQPIKSSKFRLVGKIDEIDGETGGIKLAEVKGRMGQKNLDGSGTFWVRPNEKTEMVGTPRVGEKCFVIGTSRLYPFADGEKWLSYPDLYIVGRDVHAALAAAYTA